VPPLLVSFSVASHRRLPPCQCPIKGKMVAVAWTGDRAKGDGWAPCFHFCCMPCQALKLNYLFGALRVKQCGRLCAKELNSFLWCRHSCKSLCPSILESMRPFQLWCLFAQHLPCWLPADSHALPRIRVGLLQRARVREVAARSALPSNFQSRMHKKTPLIC
jgi:hypothetical protein